MKYTAAIVALASASGVLAQQNCPAAGTTSPDGQYSCNPAHQYPAGQTCQAGSDGCYYLSPGNSAVPTPTPGACPAPGTTDSQGRYSCNPAHQYPEGQTCQAVDGCYYLTPGNGATGTAPMSTPTAGPVAGAGSLQAAGGLAMAIFGMFLF